MSSSSGTAPARPPLASGRFGLGEATVDPARNRIERGGRIYRAEPKIMRVLVALAEEDRAVHSREQLMRAVWGDLAVGEEVLTRAIYELRRMLGDDPKRPRYIETVYKTGYRLVARPRPPRAAGGSASAEREVSPVRARPVLAVGALALMAVAGTIVVAWLGAPPVGQSSDPDLPSSAASAPLLRPFDQAALIPVTAFPGHEFYSPFSPDGDAIALVWEGPHGGTRYDLWIKRLDEEEPLRLTDTPGFEDHPAWHPAGDHLAYVRNDEDGGIFMRPLLGGAERRLLDTRLGRVEGIAFSPDGRYLALGAGRPNGPPSRLYRLELATGEAVALTDPPDGSVGDFQPSWSPDGRHIAFERLHGPSGDQDIYLAPVPEGPIRGPLAVRRLTHDRQYVNGKAWMADGASLVFASRRAGYSQIWQLALDGAVHNLSGSLGRLLSPAVSPRGDRLSFTRKVVEQNIWRAALGGNGAATADQGEGLIVSTRIDVSPTYSPDGSRIAFVSYRSGHPELWLSDRDGANLIRLTHLDGPLLRLPRWSPDGRALLFEVVRTGATELFAVDADGGPVRRLGPDGTNEAYGSWSPDGRFLYFASDRGGSWQVWRRQADGGAAVQVTSGGGSASFMTAHGLFFTKPGVGGIWQLAADGERLVRDRVPDEHAGQWLVHGDGLYFIDDARPPRVRRRDLATGAELDVLLLERTGWDDQIFTIDPLGEHIVFGRCDRIESDIWMVELVPAAAG